MKKLLSLILVLVLTLTACGESTPPSPQPLPEAPPLPWHYDLLSEEQQKLYDLLESGSITPEEPYFFEEPIPYGSPLNWTVEAVLEVWHGNHAQESWHRSSYVYAPLYEEQRTENGSTAITTGIRYIGEESPDVGERERAAFAGVVEDFAESLPSHLTDVQKAAEIARFLVERADYCYPAVDPELYSALSPEEQQRSQHARDAYGALVEGWVVCQGYAEAFQVLAERVGLPSVKVSGHIENGSHAWNMVFLDGHWYHVDVTWMDTGGEPDWSWFLLSDEEILPTHYEIFWGSLAEDPLFTPPAAGEPYPNREQLFL